MKVLPSSKPGLPVKTKSEPLALLVPVVVYVFSQYLELPSEVFTRVRFWQLPWVAFMPLAVSTELK